jgi:hypothetical protein
LHGLAATRELALGAALGDDHLAITDSAKVALADDVSHFRILLSLGVDAFLNANGTRTSV